MTHQDYAFFPGYGIYSSQIPSISVSPSLAAKEKGPLSDLDSHG